MLLSIDPGQYESGYVIMPADGGLKPLSFGKVTTSELVGIISDTIELTMMVIEKPVCRKWAGREVSDTAIIAGYLAGIRNLPTYFITRSKVLGYLKCTRGGDKATKDRLVDMFSPGVPNHGKGKKDSPGFFYGFSADIWQAFALGVVFRGMEAGEEKKNIDYLLENRIQ